VKYHSFLFSALVWSRYPQRLLRDCSPLKEASDLASKRFRPGTSPLRGDTSGPTPKRVKPAEAASLLSSSVLSRTATTTATPMRRTPIAAPPSVTRCQRCDDCQRLYTARRHILAHCALIFPFRGTWYGFKYERIRPPARCARRPQGGTTPLALLFLCGIVSFGVFLDFFWIFWAGLSVFFGVFFLPS
jgi:hypothetical protein